MAPPGSEPAVTAVQELSPWLAAQRPRNTEREATPHPVPRITPTALSRPSGARSFGKVPGRMTIHTRSEGTALAWCLGGFGPPSTAPGSPDSISMFWVVDVDHLHSYTHRVWFRPPDARTHSAAGKIFRRHGFPCARPFLRTNLQLLVRHQQEHGGFSDRTKAFSFQLFSSFLSFHFYTSNEGIACAAVHPSKGPGCYPATPCPLLLQRSPSVLLVLYP